MPLAIAFRPASDLSDVELRFAHRELYEWRGEAVRKLDHKYCHIAVRLCFCIRHVLAPISGESFSVGLRLAKTTEVRAKEGLCSSRCLLRTTLCNARFLARFARYAAFCIARFLARFLHSDLSPLRLGSSSDFLRLRSCLPTESSMNGEVRPCENDRRYCQYCNQIMLLHKACACTYLRGEFLGRAAPRQDNGGTG